MTNRFALALILLVGFAIGCAVTGAGSATPTETGVLFQDDFSDPGSGWDRVSVTSGEADYADGVYRIFVNESTMDYWANPGLSFSDVRVEVDATKAGGPDDNDLGIICRYQDVDNFYYGVISSDGFAGVIKLKEGEQVVISGDALETSDAIRQGESTNRLQFDCVGDSLVLLVNGTRVATAADSEWTDGDVGLLAGTYDTPGTDVYFDNFVVREP